MSLVKSCQHNMSDLNPFNAFKNSNATWHDCNLSIERELDWNVFRRVQGQNCISNEHMQCTFVTVLSVLQKPFSKDKSQIKLECLHGSSSSTLSLNLHRSYSTQELIRILIIFGMIAAVQQKTIGIQFSKVTVIAVVQLHIINVQSLRFKMNRGGMLSFCKLQLKHSLYNVYNYKIC